MINGIDISEFQGNVDFDLLKTQVNFVFMRSSFGVGYTDNKFERNRNEARRINIVRGFYHYAYPQYNSPEDEANYFCSVLNDLQKDELMALDFEEAWNGDKVNWCIRFLNRVNEIYGFKPLFYANLNTIYSADWTSVVKGNFGLWLAVWDGDSTNTPSTSWPFVAFKQYSSTGTINGISGNVDQDVFFGDISSIGKYGYQPVSNTPPPVKVKPSIILNSPASNPESNKPAFEVQRNPQAFNIFQIFESFISWISSLFGKP